MRLVRLSRAMTRGAVYIVLVVLCALVLASVATSRYAEAAVAACVVGYVLFAVTAVRGRKT
ncbi:hypothetical protein [Promicromonospora sp. NPDC050249]|uniref:hypothetical protein n=1 Tax=Promicromonospora sp. NPDC050249 TaxID=3154743 RepID=UPI00340EFCA8